MNLKGVKLAAILPRRTEAAEEDNAKCMMLFALPAGKIVKFLSSQEMIAPFIAVIVFLIKDSHK